MQKISTIIPVINEEDNIFPLAEQILASIDNYNKELIFIDDGSTDGTKDKILELKKKYGDIIIGVFFDRNYGHQAALLSGLKIAKGDYIFTIDGDLQDPPSNMRRMLNLMKNKNLDIVNTIRKKRPGESFLRINLIYFLYFISKILRTKIIFNSGDFRLINKKALQEILKKKNKVFFLRSIVPKINLDQGYYYYNRDIRQKGLSKCNFIWLIKFAFQAFLASFHINFFKSYHTNYKISEII